MGPNLELIGTGTLQKSRFWQLKEGARDLMMLSSILIAGITQNDFKLRAAKSTTTVTLDP